MGSRPRFIAAIIALSAASVSCRDKKKPPEHAPAVAADAAPRTRGLTPIALAEVDELVPTPPGARVLRAPQASRTGERIQAMYCFDQGTPSEIATSLTTAFAAAGWENVKSRPHPTLTDRLNFSGQKPPYMLFGTIQRGPWAECLATEGKTYVMVTIQKPAPNLRVGRPPDGGMERRPGGAR